MPGHFLLLLTFFLLSLVACAGTGGVTIELKGRPGDRIETVYYSHSRVKTYSEQQLLRDKEEAVDFTVRTDVLSFDPVAGVTRSKAKTIAKEGIVKLHDLAFPELNEEIEYVVKTNGQVLKAGSKSPQSLFFIPQIPVPSGPVSVGDTWTMDHIWFSSGENIPMKLSVVAILKDLKSCPSGSAGAGARSGVCADIELSGHVGLARPPQAVGARFNSRLWGHMLFAVERGDILKSEMHSDDEIIVHADRVHVRSCMVSEAKLGAPGARAGARVANPPKLNCQP